MIKCVYRGLLSSYVFNKDADRMNEINSELERIKSELGKAVADVLDQ